MVATMRLIATIAHLIAILTLFVWTLRVTELVPVCVWSLATTQQITHVEKNIPMIVELYASKMAQRVTKGLCAQKGSAFAQLLVIHPQYLVVPVLLMLVEFLALQQAHNATPLTFANVVIFLQIILTVTRWPWNLHK